jgi:hypothetical protein
LNDSQEEDLEEHLETSTLAVGPFVDVHLSAN